VFDVLNTSTASPENFAQQRLSLRIWFMSKVFTANFSEAVRRLIDIGLKSLDEFE